MGHRFKHTLVALTASAETTAQAAKPRSATWQSLILTSLLTCLPLSSCHQKHVEHEEEEESQLIVTRPIIRDTVVKRDYVCQIRSSRNIEIRALERGYLEVIHVKEGQQVKEGDEMFKILALVYQADVLKAQAESQVAKVEYDNTKRLLDTNVVSDKEVAIAKAKLDKTLASVSLAQTHLGFTTIKAPFSGLMDRLRLRNGSLVEKGDLLTTLSDNQEMWVYFNVPEADYLDYSSREPTEESKTVKLKLANNQIFNQVGRLNVIEAEFNNKTGTIPFRADFPNPTGLLRHGATGSIIMQKTVKGALLIPQKATFDMVDRHYVFVLDKDDIIRQHQIHIAEEVEDLFVVTDGVTDKDRIIFEGLRQAKDGEKAHEYKFEEPEEAFKNLKLKAE